MAFLDLNALAVMPSTTRFMAEIREHVGDRRLTMIRSPRGYLDHVPHWLGTALKGNPDDRLTRVDVATGDNVAMAIANAVGLHGITPAFQATEPCHGQRLHVLLSPSEPGAATAIETYAAEFFHAAGDAPDQGLRIYVLDADLHFRPTRRSRRAVLEFSGLLPSDEMAAYVAIRMAGRSGPAATHLVRMLVEQFAGADPRLAEVLIGLDDEQILNLPGSMPRSALPPYPNRVLRSLLPADDALLAFHRYFSPNEIEQNTARGRLDYLYWKAAMSALMPWLELHRRPVMAILKPAIDTYERLNKGFFRARGPGAQRPVPRDLIDYSDIAAWEQYGQVRLDITSKWPALNPALEVCKWVRDVRNNIAHLERPHPDLIRQCVASMVRLLPDGPIT